MELKDRDTEAATNGQYKGSSGGEEGEDVVSGVVTVDPATQCGLGSFHPPWLQYCANMKSFTAILSCVTVFGSMNFRFVTAILIGCLVA